MWKTDPQILQYDFTFIIVVKIFVKTDEWSFLLMIYQFYETFVTFFMTLHKTKIDVCHFMLHFATFV